MTNGTLVVKPDVARDHCRRCGHRAAQCTCDEVVTCPQCGRPLPQCECDISDRCPQCHRPEGECVCHRPTNPTRFHGTVALNPEGMGRDLMRLQQEVLTHLQNAPGGRISVTLELQGHSSGYDETTVRTVNENARTLRFEQFGFEQRRDPT